MSSFAGMPVPGSGAPQRFVVVTVTGGTVAESWVPTNVGALGPKLPSILRPLESLRSEIQVLSGLSHNGRIEGDLNAHEAAALSHLTGAPMVRKEKGMKTAGISIDQAVAKLIGQDTLLTSLELGTVPEAPISFRNAESPMPSERNPRVVYDRLFRGRTPSAPKWKSSPASTKTEGGAKTIEQSVLDLVREDALILQKQLGKEDAIRMDEYLTSIRSVETRLTKLEKRLNEELKDVGPRVPNPHGLPPDTSAGGELLNRIGSDPDTHGEYIELMSDLMIMALQTDSTRVVTLALGSDEAMFPGVVTVGYEHHCHTLEHQGNAGRVEDADPISREALRQIHTWYTESFARTIAKMKAIDEGGSTLLHNSTVLYTSYMADGGHGRSNYPVVVAGRGGGTLKPGNHHAFKTDTPMSNLYVEILEQMGGKPAEFGESHVSSKSIYGGRLPGLRG